MPSPGTYLTTIAFIGQMLTLIFHRRDLIILGALLASLRYDYLSEFISMDSASILEIGPGEGYLAHHISSRHSDVIRCY